MSLSIFRLYDDVRIYPKKIMELDRGPEIALFTQGIGQGVSPFYGTGPKTDIDTNLQVSGGILPIRQSFEFHSIHAETAWIDKFSLIPFFQKLLIYGKTPDDDEIRVYTPETLPIHAGACFSRGSMRGYRLRMEQGGPLKMTVRLTQLAVDELRKLWSKPMDDHYFVLWFALHGFMDEGEKFRDRDRSGIK